MNKTLPPRAGSTKGGSRPRGFPHQHPPLWSAAKRWDQPALPDIFDEVEEDLRAERARALGRRYWGILAAALLLVLVGTGSYVAWQQHRTQTADRAAGRFIDAARQADRLAASPVPPSAQAKPDPETARAERTLADLGATGPAGYRVLARLRLAALQWQTGGHADAIATWQSVSDDTAAPALLRDLATLTSAQHQVDGADPVLLKQRLETLTAPDNRWRPMAEQVIAVLDLRTGHTSEAAGIMRRLSVEPDVPEGIRGMAADLLSTLPPDQAAPKPASGSVIKVPASGSTTKPASGSGKPASAVVATPPHG